MNVTIPYLALLLLFFAAVVVLAAQAVHTRFGSAGLVAFWLGASAALAAAAGAWAGSVMPAGSGDWGFYLVPFIFLLVEIGAVAVFVAKSAGKGIHGRRQFVMGILVFTAALIPALFAAQIPDIIRLSS